MTAPTGTGLEAPRRGPNPVRRFLDGALLPATGIGRRLALIALIDSFGTGMFLTGAALYFTRVIGLTSGQVGIGLTIAGFLGFAGAIPIGMLADKVRAGRVYVGLQLWRGVCFVGYCFTTTFPVFVVLAAAIGIADVSMPPINQAVIGAAVPDEHRVDSFAKVRAVRNIGFGAGALVATLVIAAGTRSAFLVLVAGNAASFFLAAWLLYASGVTKLVTVGRAASRRPSLVADLRYVAAALVNGLLAIHMTVLSLGLPLWISEHTVVPPEMIGILVAVNTLMTVAFQARFAAPAKQVPGAVRSMLWAGAALAGFGAAAFLLGRLESVTVGIGLAFVAVILLTCGELWHSAGGWTISYDLSRPERRAQYLSTFQLGTALQAVVGPWLITRAVFPNEAGWLYFAAGTLVLGLLMRVVVPPSAAVE